MSTIHRLGIGVAATAVLLLPLAASAAEAAGDPVAAARETSPTLEGSWRPMAEAPFGSARAAGTWLGNELVIVDIATARAAAYDPLADDWTVLEPAGVAGYDWDSPWTWTGSEFVIADRGSGAAQVFDPEAQVWRTLPAAPMDRVDEVIWADGSIVATDFDVDTDTLQTARLDLANDTWQRLSDTPDVPWHFRLLWTGDEVVTSTTDRGKDAAVVMRLRPNADAWDRSAPAPVEKMYVPPVWTGRELVFTDDSETDAVNDATYDLAGVTWTPQDFDCPISTSWAVWFDDLLFQPYPDPFEYEYAIEPGFGLDPVSGVCYALADDPVLINYLTVGERSWPRTPALWIEADGEFVLWSGAVLGLNRQPGGVAPSADGGGTIFTPASKE